MESLLGAFAPNIILILRSGMKKVIKRIFLGVFALMIFALGAGIIPSYYFLEVSDYEFENENEYYGAAEPPVRCGESHLSGLTEPPQFVY